MGQRNRREGVRNAVATSVSKCPSSTAREKVLRHPGERPVQRCCVIETGLALRNAKCERCTRPFRQVCPRHCHIGMLGFLSDSRAGPSTTAVFGQTTFSKACLTNEDSDLLHSRHSGRLLQIS